MEEKPKVSKVNLIKWCIFITVFIAVLITCAVIGTSMNSKKTVQASSAETIKKEVTEENQPNDVVDLEELTKVSEKTEEELKELNKKEVEKEIEKQKEQDKKENKDKKTTTTTKKQQNKYYIKVNYGAQVVNVYTYDKDGKYTKPVKAFVCSTGTETPRSGVYKIPRKYQWCKMFGGVWSHYATQIVGNILFHSVPYLESNNHSLEYWAYDKLGTKASMGCIRLTTIDAKWIYDNVPAGTQVEFYSSSNPGPLGKPSAKKISSAPANIRCWDPTDPDPKNPWRTYKPSTNTTKPNNNNQNNTQNAQTGNNQTTNNQATNSTTQNNQTTNNTTQNSQTNNTTQNNQNTNNTTQNNHTEGTGTTTKPNSGTDNTQNGTTGTQTKPSTKPTDTTKPEGGTGTSQGTQTGTGTTSGTTTPTDTTKNPSSQT